MRSEINTKTLELATGIQCKSPWSRFVFRLQLWVLLQHQFPVPTISSFLGCDIKTVRLWEKRFQGGEGISDRPRSGRPLSIPPEVTNRLIAFYCQHNPLPGCPRWTIRFAHTYLQNHPEILQSPISRSSLHQRLKSHALKPYRKKYFLQIRDPHFFDIMEKILPVYSRFDPCLFCLDECTGLQALERVAPRLPAQHDRPEYVEPEYIRHGTVSILSVLQVSTGQVFTECIPDHTSSTVTETFIRHALQYDPSAELHYILDNYSSHSTEEFCLAIAQLCHVNLPTLPTLIQRKQWLESTEKRIIFHFLPTHGSWLNLIEIWFGILQQKALKDVSFQSVAELENQILNFTATWNTHFAHPFQFTYTGEGLHEKVIGRLTKWLQMESPQLTSTFLVKQIELMFNLATKYWTKPKNEAWRILKATLLDKNDFIRNVIGNDEKHKTLLERLYNELHTKLKVT